MPVNNVAEFLFFVIPGFIALWVHRSCYPAKQRSAFSEITATIVCSFVILAAVAWAEALWPSRLNLSSSDLSLTNKNLAAAMAVAGVTLGGAWTALEWLRFRAAERFPLLECLAPGPEAVWMLANRPGNEDWAVVYLADGAIYRGWIKHYRYDPDTDVQDFLLTHASRVRDDLTEIYPVDGVGVYCNTRDVTRIEYVRGTAR